MQVRNNDIAPDPAEARRRNLKAEPLDCVQGGPFAPSSFRQIHPINVAFVTLDRVASDARNILETMGQNQPRQGRYLHRPLRHRRFRARLI